MGCIASVALVLRGAVAAAALGVDGLGETLKAVDGALGRGQERGQGEGEDVEAEKEAGHRSAS